MLRKLCETVFFVCLFAFVSVHVARADVPPPDSEGCFNKNEGDTCQTDAKKDGKCTKKKCSKTLPSADGGAPQTTEYDCTLCVANGATEPAPNQEPSKEPAGTPDSGNGGADTNTPPKTGGCDISSGGMRFGMGLMLLLFGFFATRRIMQPAPQRIKK